MKVRMGDTEMEVSLPMKVRLDKPTVLVFEGPVYIAVEGEGKTVVRGPCYLRASEVEVEAGAVITVEPVTLGEGGVRDLLRSKIRRPRGESQRKVLEAVEGEVTIQQIVRKTGLTPPAVYSALEKLVRKGLVVRTSKGTYRKQGTVTGKDRNAEIPVVG